MSDIVGRAVKNSEEATAVAKKCMDEHIPGFFYLGIMLGSNGKTAPIKKWLENETVKELYEQGQKVIQRKFQTKQSCEKCKKEYELIEGMKFCPFCAKSL